MSSGGKQPIPGTGFFKVQKIPKKKPQTAASAQKPSSSLSQPSTPPLPSRPQPSTGNLPSSSQPFDEASLDFFNDTLKEDIPIFETLSQLQSHHPNERLIKSLQAKIAHLEGRPVVYNAKITFVPFTELVFMCGNFGLTYEHELGQMKMENGVKYKAFLESVGNLEIFGPNAGSAGVDHMNKILNTSPTLRLAYIGQTFAETVILYNSIPKFAAFQQYRSNIVREMFQMGWRLMSMLVQSTCVSVLTDAPVRYKLYAKTWQELTPKDQELRKINLNQGVMELHNEIMTLFEMMCMGLCEAEFLCLPDAMYEITNVAGEQFSVNGWNYFVTDPLGVIHTQCKVVALQHAKLFGLVHPLKVEYPFRMRNVANKVVSFMNYVKIHIIDPILLARMPATLVDPIPLQPAYSSLSSSTSSYDDELSSSSSTPSTPVRSYTTINEQYPSPETVDEDKPHSFAVALHNASNKLRDIFWVLISDISAIRQAADYPKPMERARRPTKASRTSTVVDLDTTQDDGDVVIVTTAGPPLPVMAFPSTPRPQEPAPDPDSYDIGHTYMTPIAFSAGIGDTPVPYTPREDSDVGSAPSWL